MTATARSIQDRLIVIRRRLLMWSLGAHAVGAIIVAVVVLIGFAWLDVLIEFSPTLRIVALSIAGGCAVLLFVRSSSAALRLAAPLALARRVDRVTRGSGQVLSGVDLLYSADANAGGAMTRGLVRLAIDRAAAIVDGAPGDTVVPLREFRKPAWALAGMLIALLAGLIVAPRLVSVEWRRFADPLGDHPPYSRIEFRVEPGDTRVVYGQNVDVAAQTPGSTVEALELVLLAADGTLQEALPMFRESHERWRSTIVEVREPLKYFVRTRGARSYKHDIQVITVPRITHVRVRLAPPAYTNLPIYDGTIPPEGIAGLKGTRVEITAASNRPMQRGTLDLAIDGQLESIEMAPSADRAVTGEFTLEQSATLEVTVTDTDGRNSQEPFTTSITLLADERPFVRILEPPRHSLATPGVNIPIHVAAEDDLGISAVKVYRSLNGSRSLSQALPVAHPAPLQSNEVLILPVDQYGLEPGDVIELFARVEDTMPGGPNGHESSMTRIQIISEEDMKRLMLARSSLEMMQSKYQQAVRRMEQLAEDLQELERRIEELPEGAPLPEALARQLRDIQDHLQQAGEDLHKAAAYDLPFDIDEPFSKALAALAESLQNSSRTLQRLSKKKDLKASEAARGLKEAARRLLGDRQDYARDVTQPLDHLSAIYPLIEDQMRFVDLYQRQLDLAKRLANLKDAERVTDPSEKARMRDLESEQRELRRSLAELLDDIEAHVMSLPEDPRVDPLRHSASAFAQAVRDSDAAPAMRNAESGLAEFSGTAAHGEARRSAQILEQFLSKCRGMGREGRMCLKFQPNLAAGLGNTVDQLLASAGLGSGDGTGTGSGYSASRSTLNNVGLYGNLPIHATAGGAGPLNAAAPGGAAGARRGAGAPARSQTFATGELEHVLGTGSSGVPFEYRQRVSAYFQRVAEEFEQQRNNRGVQP